MTMSNRKARWILPATVAALLLVAGALYSDPTTKVYLHDSGDQLTVASGGVLNIDGTWKVGGTAVTSTAAEINAFAGGGLSAGELAVLNGVTAGTVTASKALVCDANKDLGDLRNLDGVNFDAGISGTAGSVDIFPTTAAKGKLSFLAGDSAGDTTTTVTNASQAGARTYTIPDAGASAEFMMGLGAQSVAGAQTYTAGAAAAAVALRWGATATEGLELRVIDEVVASGAINNDLTEDIPADAVVLSVQGNVDAALTGGGTTTNVCLGTAGDPDLYSPTVGALTANAKIDYLPDWAVTSGAVDLQVNACTGAGAAGDTALTVGSFRVRIAYLALNSLDDV